MSEIVLRCFRAVPEGFFYRFCDKAPLCFGGGLSRLATQSTYGHTLYGQERGEKYREWSPVKLAGQAVVFQLGVDERVFTQQLLSAGQLSAYS